jgi:hypothetical protein
MNSPEMILALAALAFSRQAILPAEFFVPVRSLAPRALSCGVGSQFFAFACVLLLPLPFFAVLMAHLPRQTLLLDFLASAFLGRLVRV